MVISRDIIIIPFSILALLSFSCSIEYNNGREALRKNDLRSALSHLQRVTPKDKHYAESVRLIDSVNLEIRKVAFSSSLRDYIFSIYGAGEKSYGDIDRQWSFPATKIANIQVSIMSSGISGSANISYGVHYDGSYEFTKGDFVFDTLRNLWFDKTKYEEMLHKIEQDNACAAINQYIQSKLTPEDCYDSSFTRICFGDLNGDGQNDAAVYLIIGACGGNGYESKIAVFLNHRNTFSFLIDSVVGVGHCFGTDATLAGIRNGVVVLNVKCCQLADAATCDSTMMGEREWAVVVPSSQSQQEVKASEPGQKAVPTSDYVDEDCVRMFQNNGLSRSAAEENCKGENLKHVKNIQRNMRNW